MKMWVELWVGIFRSFPAKPLKEMVGTRRLELLTSTVSSNALRFYNDLQVRGDCLSTRKSYKTSHFVGWVVGWRYQTNWPRFGAHPPLLSPQQTGPASTKFHPTISRA